MMVRGWGSSAAVAVGVAAAAGAAQLGMAYGTGVISWPVAPGAAADQSWLISLTWGCWIAATSTIVGAVVAARLRAVPSDPPPPEQAVSSDRPASSLWRLVLAVSATVGAMVTVALVAVPAREAVASVATSPQSVAAGYAILGACLGLLLALAALAARAVAANLLATAGWLWLLAVAVVVERVLTGRDWASVPLGFAEIDTGEVWFRGILLPDAGVALAAALIIGALAALPAVRRGDPPVGVVVSGGAGPLVLAVAYLLSQPDLAGVGAAELSRYLVAPYLVLVGIAGSLLISVVPRREDVASEPAEDEDAGEVDPVDAADRAGEVGPAGATDRAGGGAAAEEGATTAADTEAAADPDGAPVPAARKPGGRSKARR